MTALSEVIENDDMLKITSEFNRLGDRCYLDNAGTPLYPKTLITTINEDLLNNVYMNPHTEKYTKDCIEQMRCSVLKHFNTDPSNYTVIFTSGTTQSLKLVVEAFQFSSDIHEESNSGSFVHLRDNHTSVIGLREIAKDKNADIVHISHDDFLASLNSILVPQWKRKGGGNSLLVYPAQSNYNGYKYPIDCIDNIKNGCLNRYLKKNAHRNNYNWFVLLDAACYVSTNKLDLSKIQPDFVCLSFYKIFGYPTGLGALLVKNTSQSVLSQKRYFGGGSVDALLSTENYHVKKDVFHESFEDGTISFLSIMALKHCFDTMHKLIPKEINNDVMETISYHTFHLAKDLYEQLTELKHKNGVPAVILYMDSTFNDINEQGGIVTFNLLRQDGSFIGFTEFQHMADLFNISIRTGCFCNSGSCQRHLLWTNQNMKDMYTAGHKCGDEVDILNEKPTGCIRVSFGFFNTFNDVDRLIEMICSCFIKTKVNVPKRLAYYKAIKALKPEKIINVNIQKPINKLDNFTNGNIKELVYELSYYTNGNIPVNKLGNFTNGNVIKTLNESSTFTNGKVENPINEPVNSANENAQKPVSKLYNFTNGNVPTSINEPEKFTNGKIHKFNDSLNEINGNIIEKPINELPHFTNRFNNSNTFKNDSKIVLEEMSIFPIKSCGAFKITSSWEIGSKGFEYDREWMIVKDNGVCLTQKQNTRMCLIRPKIYLKHRVMVLMCKGKSPISIPLDISSYDKKMDTSLCHSKVCTDIVKGYDCGDEVADWVSEALEVSYLRLIRQSNDDTRVQKKKHENNQPLLSLSNQAQFLLINKATVRWLREKIEEPTFTDDIDQLTDRFRGNLIVEMKEELAERDWKKLIIGKHEFKVEGQCPRCQMVCIDQQTGEKTIEPLRTISEQFGGKLRFGIYLTYIATTDGTKDSTLQTSATIKPIINDDDINR